MIGAHRYMPILKWKQGEQLALRHLTESQWDGVIPLVEFQPIDAAPDASDLKEKIPGYIASEAKKVTVNIPSGCFICVDTGLVAPAYSKQFHLLAQIIRQLQKHHTGVIPVLTSSMLENLDGLSAKTISFFQSQPSILLRLRTDEITSDQVAPIIDIVEEFLGIERSKLHILVDQYSLVDREVADCVSKAKGYLDEAKTTSCGSITIGGGSFPMNLIGRKQGITDIPRIEWKAWIALKGSGDYSDVKYSDYTVTHPKPLEGVDPTAMNPSIAIRYAAEDYWRLYKGRGFKSKVPGELKNLCKLLVADAIYCGEGFSYGDAQYYQKAHEGDDKNGTPSSWRKEATNHHIVLTAASL